jgi:L-ornithine N5-oxygenase
MGSMDDRTGKIYDLIGIGFGPANLALAISLEEFGEEVSEHLFLEARSSYTWHPGMLLEDSLLQINVLKDLITAENPRSRFTFLNYLQEKGRLYEFLNLRSLFPTRLEFADYLTWAAGMLDHRVRYGRRAVKVLPILGDDGEVELLRIVAYNQVTGIEEEYVTRHLVLATGGEPTLPEGIEVAPGGRTFHSHHFLQRLEDFPDRDAPYRFVVVGGGQSAAEIFYYLFTRYPQAEVTGTIRRFAYKPADDSDFTNRIFFPEWVDFHYQLPAAERRQFFDDLKDVNYAVIDHELIHRIYQALYRQKLTGRERGGIRPFLELESLDEQPQGVVARFRELTRAEDVEIEADGVVLCTGYVWRKEHPLLNKLAEGFERDDLGGYRVERDYRIAGRNGFKPRVYLQGYCEDTHGISETVLSLLPVRAREIQRSLDAALRLPSEVEMSR